MENKEVYIACQDNKILGIFNSEAEAFNECLDEIERDKFWLVLKRSLLKRLLKKHKPLQYQGSKYFVARVISIVKEESIHESEE